ncbi:nuclear transport factor 2 family protein [Sphingomonas asaccharolytica]|uniref:nuclear transport factor 2 family protein n=1 Tax=Sphingomonas asaccharolytica TaxID=40681 RepID=UPI000A74FA8B|nr:nuclear transport factor 2 family protein [Sphingomonas asaccharolytica]
MTQGVDTDSVRGMSAADRRAIEWDCARLISLYAQLNDAARWDDVAALYAPDGLMTRPTAPDAPIVGRDAILAAFQARPPRTTYHVCSNIVITVESATRAHGSSAMLLFTAADAPPLVGGFRDIFVLTEQGWRFAERRGSLAF